MSQAKREASRRLAHKRNKRRLSRQAKQGVTTKPPRRNRRQHEFKVIARGVRRDEPDTKRLAVAILDMYLSLPEEEQERLVNEGMAREAERLEGSAKKGK